MANAALARPLTEMRSIAWELMAILGPVCTRIEIAGSIRREKPMPSDIELVCLPRYGRKPADLFGELEEQGPNLLDIECDRLFTAQTLGKRFDKNGRPRWGSGLKWATYRGVPVDIFPVIAPAQWGVDFLLRTGSAAFSQRFVTPVEKGGLMPKGMYCQGGALWRDGVMLETPEEDDAFKAIGLRFVEPSAREVRG